jgi:hypothetical protein
MLLHFKNESAGLRILHAKGPIKPIALCITKLVFKENAIALAPFYQDITAEKILMDNHLNNTAFHDL